MKRIILDTNFCISCINAKIDIFEELARICNFQFEVYVLDKTLEELEKIAEKNSKDGLASRAALSMLERRVKIMEAKKNVDDSLASLADEDTIIATLDAALQKRIPNKKIIIKQRKYLDFKYSRSQSKFV